MLLKGCREDYIELVNKKTPVICDTESVHPAGELYIRLHPVIAWVTVSLVLSFPHKFVVSDLKRAEFVS